MKKSILLFALALTACAVETETSGQANQSVINRDGDDPPPIDDPPPRLPRLPPPPVGEPPTTLTVWSEAGFWGDSLTHSLAAYDARVTSHMIGTEALRAKNLIGRVSSARMTCGSRRTEVFFFSTPAGMKVFDGHWVRATCEPGGAVEVNLHTQPAQPVNAVIADQITGIWMFEHTKAPRPRPETFSVFLGFRFQAQVEELLKEAQQPDEPGGPPKEAPAETDGPPITWFEGAQSFRIRQNLKNIRTPWPCPDTSGWIEYSVLVYTPPPMGPARWFVTAKRANAGGGWCQGGVESYLLAALDRGEPRLVAALTDSTNGAGNMASFYLVPESSVNHFFLLWGPTPP